MKRSLSTLQRVSALSVISAALVLSSAPATLANEDFGSLSQAPVGTVGVDGSTPLQWAVYEGNSERVRELIRDGADVNAANNYGATAMQLAAEMGDEDLIDLLLDAGADPDSPNPEGQTALMLVARTGNVDAAKRLLRAGATVDAREQWGQQTALMWASARRHPEMMALLLKEGADPDAQSIDRNYNRHLTAEGRAKNLDRGGLTPLLYAARENCLSCVEELIDAGADVDKPDPEGVSPLIFSILNTNWDITRLLIEAGADVNQWDVYGRAPLMAIMGNYTSMAVSPNDPLNTTTGNEIVRLLLDNGANPNMQLFIRPAGARGGPLSRGTTPLIVAASNGDLDMIKLLLEYGAEADLLQADRQSPVSALAGARAAPDVISEGLHLLAEHGGDVNIMSSPHHLQRNRGGAPLHFAARAGSEAAVRTLIELGADPDITDVDGLTALDHAMQRNQVPFLQMRRPANEGLAAVLRELGAGKELDVVPFWPNVGPPFYYPWHVFPLDPYAEADMLVPGSIDHQ